MRRLRTRSMGGRAKWRSAAGLALGAGFGLLALAAPAAVADGTAPDYPGSVLHVSIPGSKAAAHPVTIVATGSNQLTALGTPIDYGLFIFLVNVKLLPGPCATSEATELDNVTNNPQAGRQLNFEQYNEGESGPFTIDVPFTPGAGGTLLVCAYSEYVADDAAWASTEATITPGGAPTGGGAPANTVRPRVTRSGRHLSCTRGSWSGDPSSYSFRWKLNGKAIRGAGSGLTLRPTERGAVVCTVTAGNSSGSSSASSRVLELR